MLIKDHKVSNSTMAVPGCEMYDTQAYKDRRALNDVYYEVSAETL
jgi:hypothetical protein